MKKFTTVILSMMLATSMFTGCSSKAPEATTETPETPVATEAAAETPAAKDGKYTVVVMPKVVGIPYFNAAEVGAKKAGEDLGIEVIYAGPTTGDAAAQVKMIEDFISRGVDAIAVAPNDPAALTPVLKKAKEKGIIVIDWDTPADQSIVDASVHQINDKELGETVVDQLVKSMGTEEGDFAIVTGGLSASNLNTWIDAGLTYAKDRYPKLNLVTDKVASDEKQQVAYQKGLELMKAYPNLKGFIGYSTPAPLGLAQAVREKGMQDKISVVGTAVKEDCQEYLTDGALDVGLLWDPAKLGYLTVNVAKTILDGEKLQDGMEYANFGKVSVAEDGKTVFMGAPDLYTK